MTTTTGTPATPKQMAYLRKLVAAEGLDLDTWLIERGCSREVGFPQSRTVADVPSKSQASRLIDELAPRQPRRPRYSGRRPMFYKCTHEDYPCCGCGSDVGR